MSIETIYQDALLAATAYADWAPEDDPDEVLRQKGFSESQILQFKADYSIDYFDDGFLNGFAAVVFTNSITGKKTVSFRGTEPTDVDDLANDILLALGLQSFADFFGIGQNDSIEDFLTAAGLVDAEGNPLVAINSVDFVGHSLGGHLATMAAYKYSSLVDQVSTFNGAGLQGWDQIFNDLAGDLGGSTLDTNRVTNYFADKGIELTSDSRLWFKRPGAYQKIFIEEGGSIANHGVDKLVESLSVYRVIGLLDPTLDTDTGLQKIYSFLDSASNVAAQSLETIIDQLGDLLGGALSTGSIKDDVESFYQAVQDAGASYIIEAIIASDLSILAAQDTEAGRGYLYSLVNLLPFAVTSNLAGTAAAAAQYNLNDGDGNRLYSDKYLADKASMLGHVLSRNNQDATYPSIGSEGEPVYFSDSVTGQSFITGQIDLPNNGLAFDEFEVKRIVFGDDADNIASTLQGGEKADRLYGQGGNDRLDGQGGNDYLEGGTGSDIYIFNSGDTEDSSDGWDTLLDVDGLGSIQWNGTTLSTAKQKSEDEPNLFIDEDKKVLFAFAENADFSTSQRGTLSITEAGQFGGIKVLNYKLGELGLNLQTTVVDAQPTDYTLATTVDAPVIDYLSVARANGAVTPAEFDAFIEADLALTALDGQSNYLIGANGNDRLKGGDGDDHLHLNAGDDFVTGGAGNDIVTGGWGNNSVYAGEGDDALLMNRTITTTVFTDTEVVLHPDATSSNTQNPSPFDFLWTTSTADDTLYTGASNNRYHYAPQITLEARTWTEGTTVYTTTPNPAGPVVHHYDFPSGGAFDGLLLGTYTVTEAGGDPVVHSVGISFENVIEAEPGFDDLSGGAGDDLIIANDAGDYMVGGAGNDLLVGNGGDDVIDGGAGNDGLIGGAGNDILEGGLGEDKLYGEDGNDQLAGGDGDDMLFGDNDLLPEVEHGNDILDGGAGNDTLVGHGGNDELVGGAGDDSLFGETGDDVLSGGSGSDQLQGGDGEDVLSGDVGDDVLFGEDGDDFLLGGSGIDQLQGGDGNDVLEGGSGDDFLDGGAGADTFVFRPGAGVDVIGDADGSDSVRFISGVSLGAITSQVAYGSNDTFLAVGYGQGDFAIIKDGAEGSVSRYEFGDGRVLNTRQLLAATLEAGVYTSSGSGAPVYGGQYDDTLIGSALAEKLFGADGNDTLAGGGGDDVLDGGEGNDIYLLGHGTGQDLIVGESGETNTLKLFAGLSASDLRLERQHSNLFIHINNSRDGVLIENYYDNNKEWTIEESSGVSTALSTLIGSGQIAVRASSVAEAKAFYTGQVKNFYGSGLLARGFTGQGENFTKTIESKGFGFVYTNNYTAGITVVAQNSDAETIVRTLGNKVSTSALLGDTTSNESITALNTTEGVFASFVDGSSTYQIITDDGSSLVVGQGTSRSIIVPVLDSSRVTNPLTGVVASGIKGTWFFPNSVTPSYGTSVRSINRKTQDIDQRLTILELNAGASDNKVDASSGLFNVLDGGAGNDYLSVAGGSSLIPVPGGFLSSQGAPGSLLYGNAGDDQLRGSTRADVLIGGTGNDLLKGHGGNDRYIIFAGDGSDIIFDDGAVSGVREYDVIQLPAGVSAGDLVVSWGEALVASRITESNWIGELQSLHAVLNISWGTSDALTVVIPHTDLNSGLGIDDIEFSDGSHLAFQTLIEQAGQQPEFDAYKQNNMLTGAGQIFGGAGADVVNGISVDTGSSNGRPGPIEGDTSSLYDPDISRLIGGAGFDQLFGGDGKDELLGGDIYHSKIIVIDGEGTYAFSGLWSEGDFYKGGKADDTLWLTAGSDVIEYDLGDGNDRVTDFYHSTVGEAFGGVGSQALADASIENGWDYLGIVELEHQQMLINNHDTLRFGAGILAADIKVERIEFTAGVSAPEQNALSFSLRDGSGKVVFERWFSPSHNQLNRVEFADGTVWEGAVLESLINGEALNNTPIVNMALPDQASDEDAIFGYQIPGNTFTDVDANDSLTLSASLANDSPLPNWLNFNVGTQTFSGTPGNGEVGTYDIKVRATDVEGLSVVDTFTLTIANVNDAPVLTTVIADQQVDEDSAFDFILSANTFADIDVGDNLNVSATLVDGSALPTWLNFDIGNQTFSGIPENSDVGIVSVQVSATDSAGASVSDQFDIDVINTNDAPVAIGSVEDKVLLSGDNFSLTLPNNLFTDADVGDTLSYSLSMADGTPLPNWLSFDLQTLLLRGVPPETTTGFDELKLVATDQEGLSAAAPFNLTYSQPQSSSSVTSFDFESIVFQFGSTQNEALFGQSGEDYLHGVAGDNTLYGMGGRDVLFGGPGNDLLKGGTGNDYLFGDSGDDSYLFNPGGGQDTIFDFAGNDSLIFGAGIDKENLWLSRSGFDLLIDTVGENDHVKLQFWYYDESYQVEEISTAAGDVLHNNQVDQLVQAMASFSPPLGGVLNLSTEEQSQLEPVIAASWQ